MNKDTNKQSRYPKLKLTACAATLLIAALLILWAVQGRDPHNFEGKCSECHVGLKDPSILTKNPDHLCLSCHPDNAKRSHPSDITPGRQLPEQFPLYRGKMVCVSCHFPHGNYGNETASSSGAVMQLGPYLLRASEVGKVFCFTCHRGNFEDSSVDSHAIALRKAHTSPLSFDSKELIDDNSRECLSCHDGTISRSTHSQIGKVNWDHRKGIGMSHPISVDYEAAYLAKPQAYIPPENLDPSITLLNGKIGCATCHNHYSKNKHHLVMDNFRSRLCRSCHNI